MTAMLGPHHPIDVDKLVESRLLIQANSGAGKSWAIRRLLEQTYGQVQQIVIDVEGEFHTLREKFDYVLAGHKRSTRDAYISRLRDRGLVDHFTGTQIVIATQAGREQMPDAEPLPTGEALREFWYGKLPPGERALLEHLVDRYPSPIAKASLDELTGFKRSTRDAYLSRLAAKQLVTDPGPGLVRATDNLFDGAS